MELEQPMGKHGDGTLLFLLQQIIIMFLKLLIILNLKEHILVELGLTLHLPLKIIKILLIHIGS